MDQAELCVVPIWASRGIAELPSAVNDNGTGTLLDTGEKKLLVTNYHVLASVRELKAEEPGAGLAVNLGNGVTPFLCDLDVLAEDDELDLAVISFPDLARWQGHMKRYFPIRTWPIPLPKRGDPITIVGFPGKKRRGFDTFGLFSPVGIGMTVSNDPARHIILADTSGTLKTTENGVERPGGIEPGGMSGSAGFFFKDGWFHIAGFVYEGRPDWLFLAPGARLTPAGTLLSH